MTTYTPSPEAVEAALRTREFVAGAAFGIPADAMEQAVTAVLTAAGPLIAAQALDDAADTLAALSDPGVLAGVAGVLREHGLVRAAYRDSSYGPGIVCRCGAVVDQALDETTQETQAHHEAAEVVKWLRGQG